MKKLIYFLGGVFFAVSVTAIAATLVFKDQNNFADWYKSAVTNMQQKGIMTGYPDGNFNPMNNVNRAELAMILERFDAHVEKNFEDKISKVIANTLKYSKQEYSGSINYVIMAESGLKKLNGAPQDYGTKHWKEETAVVLPEGYKLYTTLLAESNNPSYLHFQGKVCEADYCGVNMDQWYGPFYAQ